MYYFFEIYTKHPVNKTRGWDIQTGWVKVEIKVALQEDAKLAAVAEIKKNIKNFDTVINLYRGNPRATDLDQAENLFLVGDLGTTRDSDKEFAEYQKTVANETKYVADKPEPKPRSTKTKTKWTNEKVLKVIDEARKLGRVTAADKLTELQNAGPKYSAHDENRNNRCVGTMLDVCGFASIRISARGKFFQLAKKLAATGNYRFYCVVDYQGGGSLSIYDSSHRQEMSINKAACVGQARVLNSYGIQTRIATRID